MLRNLNILVLMILLLSACDQVQEVPATSMAGQPAQTAAPSATADAPSGTPVFTLPITSTESLATLTIWIPPEFSGEIDLEASGFSDLLLTFASSHQNVETKVEQKPVSGQGGILSYLRSGHTVAPTILPDLILLPVDQLKSAATEGLIYPLDDLVDPSLFDDFFPAALTYAKPDNQTLGFPFALTQLSHLVYNRNVITTTISLAWENLVNETAGEFIFPAAGPEGATLTLELYLAAGGQLINEAGQPSLELDPLVAVLEQLGSARTGDFISSQSSNISSLDEAWQIFRSGSASLVQTTAEYYLRQRSDAFIAGVAPLPGPSSALVPLVDGWAWALSTAEPLRKTLAAELLVELTAESYLGTWSYQAGFLPSRRHAFAHWPAEDPYVTFLQQELERARPYPLDRGSSIMIALGNAVFDVISLARTPRQAAAAAVSALQP